MNSARIRNLFRSVPPTRGLRYRGTLHSLMQKNSFRNTGIENKKIKFQTFTLIWNEGLTNFKPIETTNIWRLR